ncbi:hypothetical protein [Collinsella vaginalis]|uniref:hypothetical protein n=1 Tax=Collinsella vaginalis TaxID=1870987 RepID=UPI000A266FC4|nr:hypothetical protein [Collinsella vaginalis]
MNKRIVALLGAFALAFALATPAFAAERYYSPVIAFVEDGEVSLQVYYGQEHDGDVIAGISSKQASNYTPGTGTVLGSYEITLKEGAEQLTEYSLTFNVNKEYAGKTALLYVQHEDGDTEVLEGVFDEDGMVTFDLDRLSIYTLVASDGSKTPTPEPGSTDAGKSEAKKPKKDKGSKSPQTGVVMLSGAAAVASFAVAGASIAVVRRKMNKR